MRRVYRHFKNQDGRTGYCVANITFRAENFIEESGNTTWYGGIHMTLNSAISDGKSYLLKHHGENVNIYASAILESYYDDGTMKGSPIHDSLRVGTFDISGKYTDTYETAEWL